MVYLEVNSSKNKKFHKVKPLKKQENIKSDVSSDNENVFLASPSNSSVGEKSFCDYLVVYDFEEDE